MKVRCFSCPKLIEFRHKDTECYECQNKRFMWVFDNFPETILSPELMKKEVMDE